MSLDYIFHGTPDSKKASGGTVALALDTLGGKLYYRDDTAVDGEVGWNPLTIGSQITVDGSPIAAPNFSSTTPAAPGGDTNVIFQTDIHGNVSGYVPTGISSVAWSSITNAAADLTLANAGYNTTFNQTSAVNWNWANIAAATSSGTGTFPTSFIVEPTTATRNDFTGSLGFSFTVSEAIIVNSLGRLYVAGNSQNHVITLWGSSTTTPIAQGTILAATVSDANGFKFVSITPVTLVPNITYAIAIDETSSGDTWKDEWVPSLQSQFNILQSVFSYTQSTYPNIPNSSGKVYDTSALAYTAVAAINQSSPTLNIQGTIWNGSSVSDTWSIQDVVGIGINPTSTLTISHTGSSSIPFVSMPSISVGGVMSWNYNAGFSSSGPSVLLLGNGQQGDYSGVLKLSGSIFAGPGSTFSSGYLTVTEKDNIAGGANVQGYGTNGGSSGTQHSPLTLNGTWLGNSAVPTDTAIVQVRGNQVTSSAGVAKGTAIFGVNNDDDFEIFAVYSGEDPALAHWGVVGVNTNGTAGLPISTFQVNNGQSTAYASQPIVVIARGITGETGDILQLRDFDKSSILAKFDKAANLTLLKNTTATSGTTNASPLLELAANYWTGAASAPDTWTMGSSLIAGANGASTLTIAHAGSAGAAVVNVPLLSVGIPGTSTGTIALASSTASGLFTITAPASASTPTLTLPTTSNVLAGQIAGDGTVFSSSLVTASGAGTIALPTPQNQTANTFFAGPTSAGPSAPTFRAIAAADIPSGTVIWNAIGNATGALTLANAGNATTFNQTSAVAWTWANTTTATSGTTNASPLLELAANYWTGAASAADTWTIGSSLAAGTNGISILSITHSGSAASNPVVQMNANTRLGTSGGYLLLCTASSASDWMLIQSGATRMPSPQVLGWTNSTTLVGNAADTGISRLGVASLAIGNGTAGDFTGSLKLGALSQTNGTAATSSTAQSSPIHTISGQYWNGVASAVDSWTLQDVVSNPTAAVSITNISETAGNVVTLNSTLSPKVGDQVYLTGLTTGTWLNGLTLAVIAPTGGSLFTVNDPTLHGVQASHAETGTATDITVVDKLVLGHSGLPGGSGTSGTVRFDMSAVDQLVLSNSNPLGLNNTNPALTFGTDVTTGIGALNNGQNQLGFFFSGLVKMKMGAALMEFQSDGRLMWTAGTNAGWTDAFDTGITRIGAGSLAIGNSGAGDTTGNLSFNLVKKYAGIATVSGGVPSELATVDLTSQTAAIAATTAYAVTATGMFRISWSADITTASDISSVLGGTGGFQVLYTSPTDSVVKTTVAGNSVTSAANTTGTATGGTLVVYAKTGTNIQYQFGYTDSHTSTAMAYELHLKVEAL